MGVFGRQRELPLAITNKIGGAYSANDVIGGLLTFNVANAGGGGVIRWARVVDDDNEKAELTLYLFNTAPAVIADDAAFAPSVAELKTYIGKILFQAADYETINGNAVAMLGHGASTDYLNLDFTSSDGYIYGYLVCTATPTYTAVTDLHVTLGTWLDG
jgi:hypothetical protein